MNRRDLVLSLAAAVLISLVLVPTLYNTQIYKIIPLSFALPFLVLPVITIAGMALAAQLGKKVAILWQVAKFGLVGILNTSIDFGILNFLMAATSVTRGIGIIPINAVAVVAAVVNSFYWNKDWVFGQKQGASFLTFSVVTLIGLGINTAIVFLLTTFIGPIIVDSQALWANLAKVLATIFSMVWNFLGYKLIVFKK